MSPGFTSRRPRKRRFLYSRESYYVFRMQTVCLAAQGRKCESDDGYRDEPKVVKSGEAFDVHAIIGDG